MEREGMEYLDLDEPRNVLADFPASFDDLTKDHLWKFFVENSFSDTMLADHYGVTKYMVKKKRENHHLVHATIIYEKAKMGAHFKADNERLREQFCGECNVEWLSKRITNYAFREGPIEDMHTDKQFSQEEMKTLNKFMVDRIAEILLCYNSEDFVRLFYMLGTPQHASGMEWDAPDPDFTKIDREISKS